MKTARAVAPDGSAQSMRLPVAGRIRPGIKALTRRSAANLALVKVYNEGVAVGATFDEIERALRQIQGCEKHPLAPRNPPSFRVLQSDFTSPGAAQIIIDAYGDIRDGDVEPQIYSLPIIFPSDDLDIIFREQFESWNARERVHWSAHDAETGMLMCMRRGEIDPKAKRKRWTGRPGEAVGPCDPDACDLFGAGHCKHTGALYFWIPGVRGVGLIEMTFASRNASVQIVETLELVRSGIGHVKGTHAGKPIFRIGKILQKVPMFNEGTGNIERVNQWIIQLSADLDMCEILGGDARLALPPPTKDPARSDLEPQTDPQTGSLDDDPAPADSPQVKELRSSLSAALRTLGWEPTDLSDWLFGNGYTKADIHDQGKLTEILGHIGPLADARSTA